MAINLNVSGRIFKVQKDVLCKSQLFNNMFADCDVISDEIMIYRSSKLFEHVYAYLLDNKYPYPRKYYAELDYYLIPYCGSSLSDPLTLLNNNLKIMIKDSLEEIKDDIRDEFKNIDRKIGTECPYEYCDVKCMLPVCEEHRGTCCHFEYVHKGGSIANGEICVRNIDEDQIYCHEHKDDH